MSELLAAIMSAVILSISTCAQPRSAGCPRDHYLGSGVRRSGEFECWTPIPDEGAAEVPLRTRVRARVYCGPTEIPVMAARERVICQGAR